MNERPKTKAAKNIKAGDWVSFGRLAWCATYDAETEGDVTRIVFGYFPEEFRPNQRLTMHYDK